MAAVAMLAGSAIGAIGQLRQGNANAGAARYNAQIDDRNSAIVGQQGEADAFQQSQIGYRRQSAVRAAAGASGITMDGSALDVLQSTAANAELDVQKIRYATKLKQLGYATDAELNRTRASNAETDSLYSAAATALVGGSRAYSMQGSGTPLPGTPVSDLSQPDFSPGYY